MHYDDDQGPAETYEYAPSETYFHQNPSDNEFTGAYDNLEATVPMVATLTPAMPTQYVEKLSKKIQQQAGELSSLQAELDDVSAYSRLCEQRLQELGQTLPVTKECLGTEPPQPTRVTAPTPASMKGTPSHIISSQAAQRRELLQEKKRTAQLEKQMRASEVRLHEAHKQIRALKASSGNRTSSNSSQRNRGDELVVADSTSEASSLRQSLRQTQQERQALFETARSEAQASEEQRVYIKVLEDALKLKAGEMGLAGHSQLLSELARLKQSVVLSDSRVASSGEQAKTARADLDDQIQKCHRLSQQLAEEGNQVL